MQAVYPRIFVAMVGGMVLSGCLVEELGDETTIDLTAVGGGDGLLAGTAFATPLVMPTGTNGGINDYMMAQPGWWKFNESQKQIDLGGPTTLNNLAYDSTTDTWQLTAGGTDYSFGTGVTEVCPGACVGLKRFGTSTAKYGSFAFASYDDGTNVSFAAMYYGLLTPSADVQTTGAGTFNGSFWGGAIQTTNDYDPDTGAQSDVNYAYTASGDVLVTVYFEDLGDQVKMESAGTLTAVDGAPTNGSYSVTGVATIATDNTYSGTTTATFTLPVRTKTVTTVSDPDPITTITIGTTSLFDTSDTGSINGAFYGPGGIETAGAVDASSTASVSTVGDTTTAGSNTVFVGGYWAEREVFSPF